jgi:hypothetical protein
MTRSLYRSLLWLHPPDFRTRFMDEMLWIYDETAAAGVISLFSDGLASLMRQWLVLSKPLVAAGFFGALHMALFLVMTLPMTNRVSSGLAVRRIMLPNAPAIMLPAGINGNWVGSLRSSGPSGPIELILTNNGDAWAGKLYIQGQDGAMHGGPLEDVGVQGDFLRFRLRAGDADMLFRGRLRQGRLRGTLEATSNGRHTASGARGVKVGDGIWQLARAAPGNGGHPAP